MRTLIVAIFGFLPTCLFAQKNNISMHCHPCTIDQFCDTLEDRSGIEILARVLSGPKPSFTVWFDIKHASIDKIVKRAQIGRASCRERV